MIPIPGYEIELQLHDGKRSVIYKGVRKLDRLSVIIKLLKSLYPSLSEILRFQQEYAMLRKIGAYSVVRACGLESLNNRPMIVMEDFGGLSLDRCYRFDDCEPAETLTLFLRMAEILEDIHRQRIIHKDINPTNIVWNRQTGQVKLIDFGISASAIMEINQSRFPEILEGTLAYISPEQTGRMNRTVDYRSDLYALGATFYELLTGTVPFQAQDPVEMVYAHLTAMPVPPVDINPALPVPLSDIVMRLLEKEPDNRYQSAFGLQSDLGACLDGFREGGFVPAFDLCTNDTPDYFQVPGKLYGRREKIENLLAAFDRISRSGRELILVAGPAGIGKSAMIQEISRPVTERGGLFISGKFDQFKRDIPYASIILAFQKLIPRLLAGDAETVSRWREALRNALAPNGQVMVDVIPELGLIMGKQPAVTELGPVESRNRFHLVFQNFVGVFAKADHPLVIFLDDLQWADLPSLKLLELLMTGPVDRHLMVIGAYRDSEVDDSHPFMLNLENIRGEAILVTTIPLEPLSRNDMGLLIAETLKSSASDVGSLADLFSSRTRGNPFFIKQLLLALHEEGVFSFDRKNRRWTWDMAVIERIQVTDNVVDFLIAKISRLPEETVEALKTAACIGNRFDLDVLARVNRISPGEADASLWDALREGMIMPYSSRDMADETGLESPRITYSFAHDRIQQAIYTLIDPAGKKRLHWRIGRVMLFEQDVESIDANLFEIANHLNAGSDLIRDDSEKIAICEINCRAGMKSRSSAAYESASYYFKAGIDLLPPGSWKHHHDLAVRLHANGAEAAYLNSDSINMDFFSEAVLKHAVRTEDKIHVYQVRIQAYIAQNRLMDAIRTSLYALRKLGIRIPLKPGKPDILVKLLATKLRLAGKEDRFFIRHRAMEDPLKIAAMKILTAASSPAFFAAPNLLPLLVFEQIRLSLKYGIAMETAPALSVYGVIECGVAGNIDAGYRFGGLAIELLRRGDGREYEAKALVVFNSQIHHWKAHARNTLPPLLEAYQIGLETGDLEYAAYAVHVHCCNSYCIGKNLSALERKMTTYTSVIRRLNQKTAYNFQQIWHQAVLNLRNGGDAPWRLEGEVYDETRMLPRHAEANDRAAMFDVYFHKLILGYLFGNYTEAAAFAEMARKYADGVTGMLYVPVLWFYSALAWAAVCRAMPQGLRRQRIINRIGRSRKLMVKWAGHCPENFQHKHDLIAAELAELSGDEPEARWLYRQAIEAAARHDYPNERAIACECFARFWIDRNEPVLARHYLNTARGQYQVWGAAGKIRDLDARYADLLDKAPVAESGWTTSEMGTSAPVTAGGLDSVSVLKASQAIAGEIRLPNLLKKLMNLVMENAGAQSGMLLLKRDADFIVEAVKEKENAEITVLNGIPFKNADLPESIVRFVERTHEAIVLDNADHEEKYANDPYIRNNRPKSVICLPIVHQKYLMGILYAENNLMHGAFTRQRLESLNVIASQAAIALENALLYDDLRRAESKLRNLIQTAREGFVELDNEAYITDVNPEMCHIFGVTRDQLVGRNILTTVDPQNAKIMGREHELRRQGRASTYDVTITRPDETRVHCIIKATPLFEDGRQVGSFAMVTDITDRIRAEEEIRKLNEELEGRVRERTAELERSLTTLKDAQKKLVESEKMASLGSLVAGVAHEVNTPVGVAVTAASFLQDKTRTLAEKHAGDGVTEQDLAKYVRAAKEASTLILSNLQRAAELVRSFKQVAVDQSAEKRRIFNVRHYLDELLLSMRPEYKRTRHTIAIDCPDDIVVDNFPGILAQVVTNLVMNSLIHGFDGIEAGEIRIAVTPDTTGITLVYRDNGKGMDRHVLEHVFDPFFTTRRSKGGTGLGMHVVYNLVTQTLGGNIDCDSTPGEGVTFTIYMPYLEKEGAGEGTGRFTAN